MRYSIAHSFPLLILFTSLPIFLQSVSAQNELTCISNYDEMKQSLFANGTGNMERLLYAFTPPNLPIPHYIWVYYFHNQSNDWSDILTCPPSQALHRCPIGKEDRHQDEYHAVFWGDSPMLINLDIPLLKTLSYNSILQYLGSGTCVQLAIHPFCESVDPDTEREILKFATSYLRSYSTSSEESERDYVLHCDDKFETEFAYDRFLLVSEVILCFGSGLLFVFLTFKLCTITYEREGEENKKGQDKKGMAKEKEPLSECKQEAERQSSARMSWRRSRSDSVSKILSVMEGDQRSESVNIVLFCEKADFIVEFDDQFFKTYSSVFLIVDILAISFIITDTVQFSVNTEIVRETFWYGYGALSIILFAAACVAILIEILTFIIIPVIFSILYSRRKREQGTKSSKSKRCEPGQQELCKKSEPSQREPSQREPSQREQSQREPSQREPSPREPSQREHSSQREPRDHSTQRELHEPSQREEWLLFHNVILITVLTLVIFMYTISRAFLIGLAVATYPFEVGFTLIAIGSGFVALLFVVWAAVHIAIDTYRTHGTLNRGTIIVLVPYGALLIILTGFLISYIYVILRLNIRLADPVTSLVAALVPAVVGYIASTSYESELDKITGEDSKDKRDSKNKIDSKNKRDSMNKRYSKNTANSAKSKGSSKNEQGLNQKVQTTSNLTELPEMNENVQDGVQSEDSMSTP